MILGVVSHGPGEMSSRLARRRRRGFTKRPKGHFEEAKAGPAGPARDARGGVRSGGSPENHKNMSKNEHLNLEPPILYLVGGLEHFLFFHILGIR